MRLLHVSDSYLGAEPWRSPARAQELWAGFERAVQCAIARECDVLLHSGALVSEFVMIDSVASRLRDILDTAVRARVQVVLLQDGADLTPLDVDVACPGQDAVRLAGGCVGADVLALAEAPGVRVLVSRTAVEGMTGIDRSLPGTSPRALIHAPTHYIALGGSTRVQAVQPNAWYSGQTARVDIHDRSRAGALLVELDASGRLQRVARVSWPDRAHRSLVLDAHGLAGGHLAKLLRERIAALIAHRSNGDLPALDPVLHVAVRGADHTMDDVVAAGGAWQELLATGAAYSRVDWHEQRTFVGGTLVAS